MRGLDASISLCHIYQNIIAHKMVNSEVTLEGHGEGMPD